MASESQSSLAERFSSLELQDSEAEDSTSSDTSETSVHAFDPTRCLFCNCHSQDFDDNLDHMRKRHGMTIPSPESLIVDLEALVKYLHLVVYEYTECLYCGSVRNTPQAAQQHMTGKGHCKIDIEREGSEFRDFYDFEPDADSDGDDGHGDPGRGFSVGAEDGEKERRLPSGRTVTHRKVKKVRDRRGLRAGQEPTSFSGLEGGEGSQNPKATTALAVSSGKKKDLVGTDHSQNLFNKQLATMRQGDRMALAHLPLPQQRTLVAKAKKQQEMWNRLENDQAIKLQCRTNAK